jgi:natural product biosynthesis luciferase-like monooxygenase protein
MSARALQFGIMFFSASEESLQENKYRLVLEAARFADQHAFSSVWVPERHFATLGGLYPNPSVLQAAVALVTTRIALRAGSVVLPLHDPIRVAEEWSMVDNLSGGRVGISFASGWNPADFVFSPTRYGKRHDALFDALPTVHKLWRGETVVGTGGDGREVAVRIYPKPVQPELPTWITAARSPETFVRAGEVGANVLSHLLDQDVEGMAEKIALYRDARARSGHDPEAGVVTVMLHTFVGRDADETREVARKPYCDFLKSNASLLKGLAASRGEQVDIDAFSAEERDAFVNFLYDRFAGSRALIGSPETCADLATRLWAAGVDELACLLDFGPSYDTVIESLPHLDRLRQLCRPEERPTAVGIVRPPAPSAGESLDAIRDRCSVLVEGSAFYDGLGVRGLDVEPAVRGVRRVWRRDGEALAEVAGGPNGTKGTLAPALLDACLQAGLAALPASAMDAFVPSGFDSLDVRARIEGRAWSHVTLRPEIDRGADGYRGEVRILDDAGAVTGVVSGLRLKRVEPQRGLGDWLYELAWRPLAASGGATPGSWLVLADQDGIGDALAARLAEGGSACTLVGRDEVFDDSFERLRRTVEQRMANGTPLAGIVHLWSLDVAAPDRMTRAALERAQAWGSASALVLIHTLIAQLQRGGPAPRLWFVTRGAQPVGSCTAPVAYAQAPLWGLGRTCAMEHPEIWGGLVDLDPETGSASSAGALQSALGSTDGENQVAFRGGERYVARLVRARAPEALSLEVRSDAAYLITGGLWGLGLEVARWLARKGAKHLVLLGRTELPARETWTALPADSDAGTRVAAVRDLEALGAAIHYAALDVADMQGLEALFASLEQQGVPAVAGVVHAASVWRDAQGNSLIRTLAQVDLAALRQVFGPKVAGTWVLHKLFEKTPLDFFVLFSSAASVTGSAGQGNYAAASALLDGIAHYRRQAGLSALSVNWGPVSGVGFGGTQEGLKVHQYWEGNGLKRISPRGVVNALERLVRSGTPQMGVMNIDWERLGAFLPGLFQSRWASELATAPPLSPQVSELLQTLRAAPADSRRDLLMSHVQDEVRRVMGLDSMPDPRRRLFDMGMDSLMALDLKKRLQSGLAIDVPVTAVFNYPTIDALVGYLSKEVLGADTAEPGDVAAEGSPADAVDRIRDLSDAEAERLLAERLASGGVAS